MATRMSPPPSQSDLYFGCRYSVHPVFRISLGIASRDSGAVVQVNSQRILFISRTGRMKSEAPADKYTQTMLEDDAQMQILDKSRAWMEIVGEAETKGSYNNEDIVQVGDSMTLTIKSTLPGKSNQLHSYFISRVPDQRLLSLRPTAN